MSATTGSMPVDRASPSSIAGSWSTATTGWPELGEGPGEPARPGAEVEHAARPPGGPRGWHRPRPAAAGRGRRRPGCRRGATSPRLTRWPGAGRRPPPPAAAGPRRRAPCRRRRRGAAPSAGRRHRPGPGTWMTTRVLPGRSRRRALSCSMALTSRSGAAARSKRTWRTVSGPASTRGIGRRVGDDAGAGLVRHGRLLAARRRSRRWRRPARGTSGWARPGRCGAWPPAVGRRHRTPASRHRLGDGHGHRGRRRRPGSRTRARPRPAAGAGRPRRPPRSPAATSRAKASGPRAAASSQSDDEVGEERHLLALVVDPAGDEQDRRRRARSARGSSRTVRGKTTTSIEPWRSSTVTMAIVSWRLVMTVRRPVTMPPTTTRWPSSDSSRRSPE